MRTLKKLVVVIDTNKTEQPALQRAIQVSQRSHVEILLFCCLNYPSIEASHLLNTSQYEEIKSTLINLNSEKLKELTQLYQSENIQFTTKVVWDEPVYISILKAVNAFNADMLLKTAHHHPVLERWFFNSTESQLLNACPVPLLLVKHKDNLFKRGMIAALDPGDRNNLHSKLDDRVLNAAYSLCEHIGSELHACHCFDPGYWEIFIESVKVAQIWTDVFPVNSQDDNQKVIDLLREEHNKSFAKTCESIVPSSQFQHLLDGSPVEQLPELVKRLNAGTLVLGSAYRTGLLGSTAESLLQRVDCDVLIVKPLDFESPVS